MGSRLLAVKTKPDQHMFLIPYFFQFYHFITIASKFKIKSILIHEYQYK